MVRVIFTILLLCVAKLFACVLICFAANFDWRDALDLESRLTEDEVMMR